MGREREGGGVLERSGVGVTMDRAGEMKAAWKIERDRLPLELGPVLALVPAGNDKAPRLRAGGTVAQDLRPSGEQGREPFLWMQSSEEQQHRTAVGEGPGPGGRRGGTGGGEIDSVRDRADGILEPTGADGGGLTCADGVEAGGLAQVAILVQPAGDALLPSGVAQGPRV